MSRMEYRIKLPAADGVEKKRVPTKDVKEYVARVINASPDPPKLKSSVTKTLILSVIVATFGSSFQFGYHIGCVNAPSELISEWMGESFEKLHNVKPSASDISWIWSTAVAIFAVGGVVGGMLSGWLADRFGRKGSMLLNNTFALIASALMGFAKMTDIYLLIIIGRLIIGFNAGLNSGLVPMYLTEISPINLRGTLGSLPQLAITLSILFSQILGLDSIFGTSERWPLILGFGVVFAVIQLITLPFCPESPVYSHIVKNRHEQAERDLQKLRGTMNVKDELDIIVKESNTIKSVPKVKMLDMFTNASLRWPLTIAIMMMLAQQLSGINAAMFYSTSIFTSAGLNRSTAVWATIAMGIVNVMQTIASVWLVDHPRFGRRALMMTGMVGMWLSLVGLFVSLKLFDAGKDLSTSIVSSNQWASYLAIFFVLAFVVSFATGPGSIPWFYVSEIFATGSRGNANSLACMTNWAANFVVGISFLPLTEAIGHYAFFPFIVALTIFLIFTWIFVPETKGKTVEENVKGLEKKAVTTGRAAAVDKEAIGMVSLS